MTSLVFRQLFCRTMCTYTFLVGDGETCVLIDPVDAHVDRDLRCPPPLRVT